MCICMLTKRTNIIFHQSSWDKLVKLSKTQSKSAAELIRSAVDEYYGLKNDSIMQIRDACNIIEKKRKKQDNKVDYKSLINYGRKT